MSSIESTESHSQPEKEELAFKYNIFFYVLVTIIVLLILKCVIASCMQRIEEDVRSERPPIEIRDIEAQVRDVDQNEDPVI